MHELNCFPNSSSNHSSVLFYAQELRLNCYCTGSGSKWHHRHKIAVVSWVLGASVLYKGRKWCHIIHFSLCPRLETSDLVNIVEHLSTKHLIFFPQEVRKIKEGIEWEQILYLHMTVRQKNSFKRKLHFNSGWINRQHTDYIHWTVFVLRPLVTKSDIPFYSILSVNYHALSSKPLGSLWVLTNYGSTVQNCWTLRWCLKGSCLRQTFEFKRNPRIT